MIELSDDIARLDVARVHGWLATSYWSPGIDHALIRPKRYMERVAPEFAAALRETPE